MEVVKTKVCEHEMEEGTEKFIEGKGLLGTCKKCGAKLVRARVASVKSRRAPHMSKKQRLKERRHQVLDY